MAVDSEAGRLEMKYTVIIEKAPANYAAYAPDLPGCVATGASIEDAQKNMRAAIEWHLRSIREHGEPVPVPRAIATHINVA
ncbi:MAG TPA: type II toxin-antitoxin system HicB family antitoxin [Candidatus Tyrphobacter sp.]